jgi:hypothetical protein
MYKYSPVAVQLVGSACWFLAWHTLLLLKQWRSEHRATTLVLLDHALETLSPQLRLEVKLIPVLNELSAVP